MFCHRRKRLPVNALFINAQATPFWFALENLMGELIYAGCGFTRTRVTSDEPAPTKLVPFPSQLAEAGGATFTIAWPEQEPRGDKR